MDLTQLKLIYEEYEQALAQAHKKASIFAGLFGQGSLDDPRSAPCNKEFYEKTGAWAAEFAASSPDQTQLTEVCRFMLEAAKLREKKPAYWYMLVAQGHTKCLIPLLSGDSRRALAVDYGKWYPKRLQLPLQQEIAAALEKS